MNKTVTPKVLPGGKKFVLYIVTVITFCALNCMVLQAGDFDGPYLYAENDIFKLINEEQKESALQIQCWMLDFNARVPDDSIPEKNLNKRERMDQTKASVNEYIAEPELKVREWMVNIDSRDQAILITEP